MIRYNLPGTDVSKIFNESPFPAGENNIFIKPDDLRFADDSVFFIVKGGGKVDLMEVGMKVDILRREGFSRISLVLPYLPYSRQDRYTTKGSSFSLKVFGDFINSLRLHRIYTVDAHSDVVGVIDGLVDLPITGCIDSILDGYADMPVIIAPDAGANKKIYKILESSKYKDALEIVTATKHRNVATGEITGMSLPEIDPWKPVLVIDDICDGGRTFTELAKLLPTSGNALFVTHGVFSKPDVFDFYDTVITTDTINTSQYTDKAKLIPLIYREEIIR